MTRVPRSLLILIHVAAVTTAAVWLLPRILPPHSAAPAYDLQEITLAGYTHSTAAAVSADGAVTGYAWNDDPYKSQPWVWQTGRARHLPLPSGLVGAQPTGINRHGHVVGTGYRSDKGVVGLLWRGEQVTVWDRSADDIRVLPTAINDRGQVVRIEPCYRGPAFTLQSVLWERGQETVLGDWHAKAINDKGIVAGTEFDDSFVHWSSALTCQPGKKPNYLLIPKGYSFAEGYGINVREQVVGILEGKEPYAALWAGDKVQVLAKQPSVALAINDAGQVVGYVKPRGGQTAFLWQQGKLTRLQDLVPRGSCKLTRAHAINRSGQIVGRATSGRKMVAFVLTPRSEN